MGPTCAARPTRSTGKLTWDLAGRDRWDGTEGLAHDLLRRLDLLAGASIHGDTSYSQYKVLSVIHNHGPITVGNLGKVIGSAQSTTSEMVARLSKSGLVQKLRGSPGGNVTDGRVVTVEITDLGRQLVKRRRKHIHEGYLSLFNGMSPVERDTFLGALQQIDALLRKGMEQGPPPGPEGR